MTDPTEMSNVEIGTDTVYGYGKMFGNEGCHISLPARFRGKLLRVEIVKEEELEKKLEEKAGGKQASLW